MQSRGWLLAIHLANLGFSTPPILIWRDALPSWREVIWLKEMHITTATALLQRAVHVSWHPGIRTPVWPSHPPQLPPQHAFLLFSTWFDCLDLMTGVDFVSYIIWFSFPWFWFLRHSWAGPRNWTVSGLPVYGMETWSESKHSNIVSVHDITLCTGHFALQFFTCIIELCSK